MAEEHNLEAFRELLDTPSISDEDIAEMAGVPVDVVVQYRSETSGMSMGADDDGVEMLEQNASTDPLLMELMELCRNRSRRLRTTVKIPLKPSRGRRRSGHVQISMYKARMVPVVLQAAASAGLLHTLQVVDVKTARVVFPRPGRTAAPAETPDEV